MSLISRQLRPLGRDRRPDRFRDDRIFLVACDDRYAPKQYFDFFKLSRVTILVAAAEDNLSAPRHALERLRRKRDSMNPPLREDDECWLVLDTDHHLSGSHRANLIALILEAEADNIHVALSCPCFEFWLLLHHVDEVQAQAALNCEEIQGLIRSQVGEYNKTNLKREHYHAGSAADATLRAERLDDTVCGGHLPEAHTTRVYKLIRAITAKGLPSDLPPELRGLAVG